MFQNSIQTFFFTVKWSCAENRFKHFLRACSVFDHGTFRSKVSTKDCDTSICSDGFVIWTDDVFLRNIYMATFVKLLKPFITFFIESVILQFFQVFSQCLSGNSHDIQVKMLFDLFHDCRYTTCIIEALCRPATCRTYIQKISCISVQLVKCITGDLNAKLMSDCRKMKQAVGAS